MDRVSDYGSEGWGFKSLRGRVFYKIKDMTSTQEIRKEKNLKRDTKDSIRVIYLKGTEENSEKVE